MFMILATEPDPREALVRLIKRSAYVLVPFSILLIKYYPSLGREFSPWSGAAMNTGVTTNKNELGYVCLILGLLLFWHFVTTLRREKTPKRRKELFLTAGFLCMICWLLYMANSATSLMSLAVGVSIVMFLGLSFVNRRHTVSYLIAALVTLSYAELAFGVTDTLIAYLGRDSGLSGRVELWNELRSMVISPIIGAGFESFWLGTRAELLWAHHWWRPNQAHNGYLETYLNLGWIGVMLLLAWIASAFAKARATLLSDFDFGRLQLAVIATVLVYNYTEGALKGLHPLLFLLYIVAMEYPRARSSSAGNASRPGAETRPSRRTQAHKSSIAWRNHRLEPSEP